MENNHPMEPEIIPEKIDIKRLSTKNIFEENPFLEEKNDEWCDIPKVVL